MKRQHFWLALAACGLLNAASIAPNAFAQDYSKKTATTDQVALPPAAEVNTLAVAPATVTLKGLDDSTQLVITGQLKNGKTQDFSGDVQYTVANPAIARVTTAGRVMPIANGATEITATYGDKSIKIALKSEAMDQNLPIKIGRASCRERVEVAVV